MAGSPGPGFYPFLPPAFGLLQGGLLQDLLDFLLSGSWEGAAFFQGSSWLQLS